MTGRKSIKVGYMRVERVVDIEVMGVMPNAAEGAVIAMIRTMPDLPGGRSP